MAISLSDNILNTSNKPDSYKYGTWNSVAEAVAEIPATRRHLGLTVGIIVDGIVVEYWWRSDLTDGGLIAKESAAGGFASVTKPDGSKAFYETFTTAYDAAVSGDRVALHGDTIATASIILKDGVTINLNGYKYTLDSTSTSIFAFTDNAVSITASILGYGKITRSGGNFTYPIKISGITSNILIEAYLSSGGSSYAIGVLGGTVKIFGTISDTTYGIYISGNANVSLNGNIRSLAPAIVMDNGNINGNPIMTVYGNAISTNGAYVVQPTNDGKVYVYGNIINLTGEGVRFYGSYNQVFVSGGIYSQNNLAGTVVNVATSLDNEIHFYGFIENYGTIAGTISVFGRSLSFPAPLENKLPQSLTWSSTATIEVPADILHHKFKLVAHSGAATETLSLSVTGDSEGISGAGTIKNETTTIRYVALPAGDLVGEDLVHPVVIPVGITVDATFKNNGEKRIWQYSGTKAI